MLLRLIGVICLLFLSYAGVMPSPIGFVLSAGTLAWLAFDIHKHVQHQKALSRRRNELEARWAVTVRHLSGLSLPVDTLLSLFYTGDRLILESDQEQWIIQRQDLQKIFLTAYEPVRRMSDRELRQQLNVHGSRTFFALREKIRHHDSTLRRSGILILTYRPSPDEQGVWVLVSPGHPQTLANLIQASGLRDWFTIRLAHKYRDESS